MQCGERPLREIFLYLYAMASNLRNLVTNYVDRLAGVNVWAPIFCRKPLDDEIVSFEALSNTIKSMHVSGYWIGWIVGSGCQQRMGSFFFFL